MEFLIENENELRVLAEKGDYWDILHLADFLYDEKRYAEAKAWYLKIAGSDDLSGDANSHLFQMLLDMGEYAESLEYFGYIQSCCDTSPREGAYMRMMQELCNPESKLFMYFDEESFYYDCLGLIYSNCASFYMYSQLVDGEEDNDCETGELYLKKNMETILLTRAKSEDEEIQKSAKRPRKVALSNRIYIFPVGFDLFSYSPPCGVLHFYYTTYYECCQHTIRSYENKENSINRGKWCGAVQRCRTPPTLRRDPRVPYGHRQQGFCKWAYEARAFR